MVGGGPAGLYAAYFLRDLGPQICVLEQKDVWGGKQQVYQQLFSQRTNLTGTTHSNSQA